MKRCLLVVDRALQQLVPVVVLVLPFLIVWGAVLVGGHAAMFLLNALKR